MVLQGELVDDSAVPWCQKGMSVRNQLFSLMFSGLMGASYVSQHAMGASY